MTTRYIIYKNSKVIFASGGTEVNLRMYVRKGNVLKYGNINEWTNTTDNAKRFSTKSSAMKYLRMHTIKLDNVTYGVEEIYY